MLMVESPGVLCTIQDAGRLGLGARRFGIPPAGAMDRQAFRLANRLLDNPPDSPVLECLQGARLRVTQEIDVALAGSWGGRAWRARPGECIEISASQAGVWHYLALPGGLDAAQILGSASTCLRAGIGQPGKRGDTLRARAESVLRFPPGVARRYPAQHVTSDTRAPLQVWPGPQWADFAIPSRQQFFAQVWRVSARSDRTGYRLEGAPIKAPSVNLPSEPVRIGSIQIPPGGQPIVTLYDGPTVGGYAKIGLIDPADLDRLVQTRPGQELHFILQP